MKVVTVQDIAAIVKEHGFDKVMLDLVKYIKEDFSRWNEFDKSPRHAIHVDGGVIELMPVADKKYYTYKYVNGHPKNPLLGKPTIVATGQLSQVSDGHPLMVSEMTVLTGLRTAATAIIATDILARKDSKILAVIGTGSQSEFQTLAHKLVRDITSVRYYDTDPHAMTKYARNLQDSGLNLIACKNVEEALDGADIVIVCTACKGHVDVIPDRCIKPGVHINGLGGDCPGKTELELSLLSRCKIFVEYIPQSMIEGEIQRLNKEQVDELVKAELWELISNKKQGRSQESDITLFDSVGFALEDYSVLRLVYDLANKYQLGHELDLIPSLSDPKDLISTLGFGNVESCVIPLNQVVNSFTKIAI